MDTKTIIVRAAALVAVITGLFGGFLLDITPPDNEGKLMSEFSQGIYSSILLCIILLLWAYSAYFKNSITPRKWLMFCVVLIAAFCVSSIGYFYLFQNFTYIEPISTSEGVRHLHGHTFTTYATTWVIDNPNLSKTEMVKDFEYKPDLMWLEESIYEIQSLFFISYLIVSTSLTAAIVCLSELICNSKAS